MKITLRNYNGNQKTMEINSEDILTVVVDLDNSESVSVILKDGSYRRMTNYDDEWDEYSPNGLELKEKVDKVKSTFSLFRRT